MKTTLITTAFLAFAANSSFAAQSSSEIHVLGQDGNALEILVDHNGAELALL